jgi:hypothetical protein
MDEAVLIVMITRIHFVLLQLISKYCIRKRRGLRDFGYAAIFEKVGSTNIWVRVNINAQTLGPPGEP